MVNEHKSGKSLNFLINYNKLAGDRHMLKNLIETMPIEVQALVSEVSSDDLPNLSLSEIGVSSILILQSMMAIEEMLKIEFSDDEIFEFGEQPLGVIAMRYAAAA